MKTPMSLANTRKGKLTRNAILDSALDFGSQHGIGMLSFGTLAEKLKMSKSGVVGHFRSRDNLITQILERYNQRFRSCVLDPRLAVAPGLPRVLAIFQNLVSWIATQNPYGCLFISSAMMYDDSSGWIRDALKEMLISWQSVLESCICEAIEQSQLAATTDPLQLSYEIRALILVLHHEIRFMRNPDSIKRAEAGFARLLHVYTANESMSVHEKSDNALCTKR